MAALRIRLPAKPDNVAVVRQALTGMGDAYELDPDFLSDIRTAVTEACNNVVIHAYPGDDPGLLEVEADPGDGTAVDVLVRDYGAGLQPNTVPPQERSLGLGLPLIAALARRFEIRSNEHAGLEVHMLFAGPDPEAGEVRVERMTEEEADDAAPTAGMSIVPGPLVSAISGRVTAMLAARADFPLDRLADAVLISDAISAHAEKYVSGDVGLAIHDDDGSLDFRVGPLRDGGAKGLISELEVPGFGGSLERLVDNVSVEEAQDGPGEYLVLTIRREED